MARESEAGLEVSLLAGFPVVISLPVQWGELDAYGHVNNAVFFRYFESARMEYLDRCGLVESYKRDRIGAILHSTSCRFRRALFHPDTVLVGAKVTRIDEDRLTMAYRIVSQRRREVVADGTGIVVVFDYRRRAKTRLPEAVREALEALERGEGSQAVPPLHQGEES
jgi:acyl-CoA thioester hydrolase